jgi:hypothetical protein
VKYLDFERLEAIDPQRFRTTQPYPWINPSDLISSAGFESLVDTLPDVSGFRRVFGRERKFGQKSHDRFALDYTPELELAPPWRDFMAEITSHRYAAAIARLAGRRSVDLSFHWHYTPRGCSVSPHCDSKHKLGSHIFYFSRENEWDTNWGGATLILDSDRRHDRRSAPGFDDFDREIEGEHIGNRSLLFVRRNDSWHGVREIQCPEGLFRKVFIVVLDRVPAMESLRRQFGKTAEVASVSTGFE